MFTVIDWIVLAAYLLLSLLIGLWVSRGNKNLKEYMFGGGSIPWVAVGIIGIDVHGRVHLDGQGSGRDFIMVRLLLNCVCRCGFLVAFNRV